MVAPHAGAWIETIKDNPVVDGQAQSHPTRVRGLKHFCLLALAATWYVAPHAGAWIETRIYVSSLRFVRVAPHAGAWIETHLSQRRRVGINVAPHAGAWIETSYVRWPLYSAPVGRTPRGCVD